MALRKKKDPHARLFGVEIECGMPGGLTKAAELFGFSLSDYGSPVGENADGWTLGSDGSGVELRTPPLKGTSGFDALRDAMETLKANDAFVQTYDGLHVHHDAPEFIENAEACLQLVQSWRNNQNAIDLMVAPRRRTSGACPKWGNSDFANLKMLAEGKTDYMQVGRRDLNLSSMESHGTIEFRLHEGTLDPEVAIAWIKFGQRFLHSVLQRVGPIKPAATDRQLMSRIRLPKADRIALEAKRLRGYDSAESAFRQRQSTY